MNLAEINRRFVEDSYSFTVRSTTIAPRGFVAETYFLVTDNGEFFLKLIKKGLFTANLSQSLKALNWLAGQVDFVQAPIQSTNGENWIDLGEKIAVVFPKIEATSTDSLGINNSIKLDLIGQIQALNPNTIKDLLILENFQCLFEAEYLHHIQSLPKNELISGHQGKQAGYSNSNKYEGVAQKLQKLLAENKHELDQIWQDWGSIKQTVRSKSKDNFVITHSDVSAGNLIQDINSKIWLIDWDDLILAPKERDLWIFTGNCSELDQDFYGYYLYQRFLADLTDWMNNIFGNELSEEEKEKQFQDCLRDCFDNFLPRIREYRKLR